MLFIKKFWYWICICICFNSLYDLIELKNETFETSGLSKMNNNTIITQISICIKINSTNFDCSELTNKEKQVCENLNKYFKYIEDGTDKTPQLIINKYDYYQKEDLFSFNHTKYIKLYNYLDLNRICFLYSIEIIFGPNSSDFSFDLINKYNISSNFHIFGTGLIRYQQYQFLNCHNFKECIYFTLKVRYYNYKSLEKDCSNDKNEDYYFFKFENISNRVDCLQECIKHEYRLSEFYYTANDIEILKFKSGDNYNLIDDNLVKKCRKYCNILPCKYDMVSIESLKFKNDLKNVEIILFDQTYNQEKKLFLSDFNFWRKFLGLFALFFKMSILSLIIKLDNYLRRILNKKIFLSISLILIWSFLIASFFYGSNLAIQIYKEYNEKKLTSYLYLDLPFSPTNFSIALCETFNNLSDLTPVSKIENRALKFNSSSNFIILFENKIKKLNILNSRYFYKGINKSHQEHCFQTDVFVEEERFKSILSLTRLFINTTFDSIYLGEFNRSMTTRSQKMNTSLNLIADEFHLTNNYNNYNCTDYQEKTSGKCNSMLHCRDVCINKKSLNSSSARLNIDSLIYLDEYDKSSKDYLFFDLQSNNSNNFRKECENEFSFQDCKILIFFPNEMDDPIKKNISLFFQLFKHGNRFNFNFFQMACAFITLLTIITGINLVKLARFTVFSINFVFRIKRDEQFNFRNLIFLTSITCFLFHSYYIYDKICNTELDITSRRYITYYDPNKDIPDLLICLHHLNTTFKNNEIKTGKLLNEKTAWLNENYLFEKIDYYDLEMNKKIWKPEIVRNNSRKSNLNITTYFMHDYKCFEIQYELATNKAKNLVLNSIITIKFNKEISHSDFFFISKAKDTWDFSANYIVNFQSTAKVLYFYFKTNYYDPYQTLKNPKLWFNKGYKINQLKDYLETLKDEFKEKYNLTTKLIPLTEEYYDLEIDDDLFEQFYLQYVHSNERYGYIDYNYDRTYFETRLYSYASKGFRNYTLSIDKIHLYGETEFTKKEYLILNYLNIVFLYFNFYLLDLLELLSKFASFFLIFSPKKIRKKFFQIKIKIDQYFSEENKISPIYKLNYY